MIYLILMNSLLIFCLITLSYKAHERMLLMEEEIEILKAMATIQTVVNEETIKSLELIGGKKVAKADKKVAKADKKADKVEN